jgi:hypothetical protein
MNTHKYSRSLLPSNDAAEPANLRRSDTYLNRIRQRVSSIFGHKEEHSEINQSEPNEPELKSESMLPISEDIQCSQSESQVEDMVIDIEGIQQ